MLQLDHFAVQVSDLERSIEFYKKIGLEYRYTAFDEENHERYAFFTLPSGGSFELLQVLDEQNNPIPLQKKALIQPFCPHIAFTTSDMNETMAMIQEKGFEIVKGPMNIPDEVSWVFIKDYDNNVVEFVEWIGEKR